MKAGDNLDTLVRLDDEVEAEGKTPEHHLPRRFVDLGVLLGMAADGGERGVNDSEKLGSQAWVAILVSAISLFDLSLSFGSEYQRTHLDGAE